MLPFGGAGLFNVGKTVVSGTNGAILVTDTAGKVASLADVATGSLLASGGVGAVPAFSASPTLTTSLTVPTVLGGTGVSGGLILQSTSNATRGVVSTPDKCRFVTDAQVFGATSPVLVDVGTGAQSVTTGAVTALRYGATLTVKGNSAVSLLALFNAQCTVTDDGTARTPGPALFYASQPTYTATVAGGLAVADFAGIPGIVGVYSSPTLNRTGAGTGTVTTMAGLYVGSLANIGTGWTVTDYVGVLFNGPTVGGTVTNIYGFRSTLAAATARWAIFCSGTAQSAFAGNVRIGSTTAPNTPLDVTGVIRTDQTAANAAVATVLGSVGPTGAATTVQEWFKLNINGTTRFIPCF